MTGTKFSFWAYGILAIAAFAMLLYTTTSLSERSDIGNPLLGISVFIVAAFVIYMFAKLFMRRF
jgi:VIT1/CCC1 family predicted Fe2+/Mn2+ transporter